MIRNKILLTCVAPIFAATLSCTSASSQEGIKFQQYYAQGETIYLARCSNCHQKSGKGLALVYPPLEKSDYMDKNFEEVVCLIKHGKKGPLTVNGEQFNQPMPGVPTLTGLEVAELATYIYNTWGRDRGTMSLETVQKALEKCD